MRTSGTLRGALLTAGMILSVGSLVAAEHPKCTRPAEECAAMTKRIYQTRGWMGVELDPNEDGSLRITSIVPRSPAEKAGLKVDDVLVSVNGTAFSRDTFEKLMIDDDAWRIGSTIEVGLRNGGGVSTARVTLQRIPEARLAQLIEFHEKEFHQTGTN